MTSLSPQFWLEVEAILDDELAILQSRTFAELTQLPESQDHGKVLVGKRDVSLTLFSWRHDPSSVVVVVQGAVQQWLGLFWRSFEKGFVALEDGTTRAATQKELASVL